jgi:hypothetical protein
MGSKLKPPSVTTALLLTIGILSLRTQDSTLGIMNEAQCSLQRATFSRSTPERVNITAKTASIYW